MQEMHAAAPISSAHCAAHWATVPAHLSQFLALQPCMNPNDKYTIEMESFIV